MPRSPCTPFVRTPRRISPAASSTPPAPPRRRGGSCQPSARIPVAAEPRSQLPLRYRISTTTRLIQAACEEVPMSLVDHVVDGFRSMDADVAIKDAALANVRQWLTNAEYAAYRPQLEWLIAQQKWGGLLDRFFQVLPFGTGGRRGPVGIGPNRMN